MGQIKVEKMSEALKASASLPQRSTVTIVAILWRLTASGIWKKPV